MDSIRYMVKFMHCAMVAMEPQSGAVRAWVGDIDFKTWRYDKVVAEPTWLHLQALCLFRSHQSGLTPCDKRRDEYISMQVLDKEDRTDEDLDASHNANGRFSNDSITLKASCPKHQFCCCSTRSRDGY